MGGFNFGAFAQAYANKQNNTANNTVQGTVTPQPAIAGNPSVTQGTAAAPQASVQPSGGGYSAPTYSADQLKAINDVTYLKQQYDAAKGAGKNNSASYLANQAQGIYKGMDPTLAKQLQGMNANQASSFYAGAKNPTPAGGSTSGTDTPNGEAPTSQRDEMWAKFQEIMDTQGANAERDALRMQQMYDQQINAARGQYQGLIGQANADMSNDLQALQNRYNTSKDELGDNTFQQWLEARQGTADRGLAGSGLASDADTRLLMANNKNLSNLQNTLTQEESATKSRYGNMINNYNSQLAALPSISGGVEAARAEESAYGLTDLNAGDATASLARALGAGGAELPQFYSGNSSGSGASARSGGGFDASGAYLAGVKEFLPYYEATMKDKMNYDISNRSEDRLMSALRGYFDDGSLTLDAHDKAAKNQMDLAKILGQFSDGTQTLEARNSAINQQMDLTKLFGFDKNGNSTLDARTAEAVNKLGYDRLSLDQQKAEDTSKQNWTKINTNAAQWERDFALKTYKTTESLANDRARINISQQDANTKLATLQQSRMEWSDKETRADANAQAGAIDKLMKASKADADAAYKKMQDHLNSSKKAKDTDPAYIAAQKQYTKARKQYEVAYGSLDKMYEVGINKSLTPQKMTAEMKKIAAQAKQDFSAAGVLKSVQNGTWGENSAKSSTFKAPSGGSYTNYYKAAKDSKANPKDYATASSAVTKALESLKMPKSWIEPTLELVARESSFNSKAKNPKSTAAGLFQFLNGTRKNYGGNSVDWADPYQQSLAGIKYIKDRYGTPDKALQFWDKNQWY